MSESSSYGFGGKLIASVVVALLCGYLWACVEMGKNPVGFIKKFLPEEEVETAKAPTPKTEPRKTEPVAVKKSEPAKAPEPVAVAKKAEPLPAPSASKMYSAVDMSILFNDADDLLRRGKLFEARDRVKNTSKLMVPDDAIAKFNDYEARVGRYHALLLETSKGGTIEMPKMTQILIKDGGKLIVKIQNETATAITYETLTGIRSRIEKSRCEEIKTLEPVYGRVEVSLELKKQADYKGLVVEQEPGKPLSLKDKPGRTANSLQIFDLADFCARNGANDKLVPLFDAALARDPDLLNTVHEAKADRMIDVLIYFLNTKALYDARKTMELLKDRYADSKAYKERIDSEFIANADLVLNKRPTPSTAIAKAADPKPEAPKPVLENPAPKTEPPDERVVIPPPETPAPRPEPADAPVRIDPGTPGEVTSVGMPDGTNQKITDLVAKGDRYFKQAMEHLNNCDPRLRPETAGDENKKALKLFMQANAEGYGPAQDEYKGGARVPEALLDRFREAQQRAYFCRKFAVATKR